MIAIVPCGSAKLARQAKAGQMYTGTYHRACMTYALSLLPSEQVFILSAKYGLLALDDQIEPYNLKMGQPGSIDSKQVIQQAQRRGLLSEQVMALGGRLYTGICREVWPYCVVPLEGIGGMGKQIAWMSRHRGRAYREETS